MRTVTRYHVNDPDTVSGYSVQIITTLSTFDKNEFDAVVSHLQETLGSFYVGDVCIALQPSCTIYDDSEGGENE